MNLEKPFSEIFFCWRKSLCWLHPGTFSLRRRICLRTLSAIPAKPSSLSVLMENRAAATRWPDSEVQRHWWRPRHWRSRGQSGGCQSETPQIPWTPAALWRRLSDRTGWGPEKQPLTAQLPYMLQSGWKNKCWDTALKNCGQNLFDY